MVIMTVTGIYVGWDYWLRSYADRITMETVHYTIYSTATKPQTLRIGEAAESLYIAYTTFFKDILAAKGQKGRLKLNLYGDKQEFIRHNKSKSWAEAFYQAPYCYAYYPVGESNPYHWMLHEGTHQLNSEVAHFKIPQWIDEGLATYFGTSKLKSGKLLPGQIDVNTYPIWWLRGLSLTGSLPRDIRAGKIISLRSLITDENRSDMNKHFNLYYMEYWSLTHFLFHFDRGKYSDKFRKLIVYGGSLESFEKEIGPIDRIQSEWYSYFQRQIAEVTR